MVLRGETLRSTMANAATHDPHTACKCVTQNVAFSTLATSHVNSPARLSCGCVPSRCIAPLSVAAELLRWAQFVHGHGRGLSKAVNVSYEARVRTKIGLLHPASSACLGKTRDSRASSWLLVALGSDPRPDSKAPGRGPAAGEAMIFLSVLRTVAAEVYSEVGPMPRRRELCTVGGDSEGSYFAQPPYSAVDECRTPLPP